MFGILIALAAIVTSTFLVSVFSVIFIPALHFSGPEFIRLGGFYAVSFLYLAFFALLGLVCAIRFTSESVALFTPIMVWIALMFIFPELATGQNPVALLNPITLSQAAAPQGAFFSLMHTVLWPFSAGQHYTASAMMFLEAGPNAGVSVSGGMAQVGSSLMALITYLALLVGASVYAARSYVIASDPLV
jgi:ABC-type transport system involved in multi-copper enzyme maturation permease subunit